MKSFLLVMIGGGLGAGLRHGLGRIVLGWAGPGLPWGTFIVNLSGGLAMGVLVGALARHGASHSHDLRLILGVGLLGGFTTFSAFSLETANMIERGQLVLAASYAFGSVIAAVAALFAGLALVRTVA